MAEVKYQHVYKIYDNGVEAVRDFHLDIEDGEFVVLVGPSGCGKTTTLRMLAGLEEISKGDLFIGTRRINDLSPRDRDIAMVFQNYALYPHLSVRENMGFSLKLRGIPVSEIEQKINAAAEILGLQEYLKRKPKELSGGQRQRVAMGRAIVRQPQVFLFDEPLSNLDAKLRVEMRVEIAKLHKRLNNTIIYVTHDQVEAMTLADRIVVMKSGSVQQVGTPLEIYTRPTNTFVAGFIGTPPMNQMVARLDSRNGQLCLIANKFAIPLASPMSEAIAGYKGQEIMFGIRPEDISLSKGDTTANFQVPVVVIEPMGNESYVYFSVDDKEWICRHAGVSPVSEGETANLIVDRDKLHIFTRDGSRRLY